MKIYDITIDELRDATDATQADLDMALAGTQAYAALRNLFFTHAGYERQHIGTIFSEEMLTAMRAIHQRFRDQVKALQ